MWTCGNSHIVVPPLKGSRLNARYGLALWSRREVLRHPTEDTQANVVSEASKAKTCTKMLLKGTKYLLLEGIPIWDSEAWKLRPVLHVHAFIGTRYLLLEGIPVWDNRPEGQNLHYMLLKARDTCSFFYLRFTVRQDFLIILSQSLGGAKTATRKQNFACLTCLSVCVEV